MKRKLPILTLVASLILASPTFATESPTSFSSDGSNDVLVNATVESNYTIAVPAYINLVKTPTDENPNNYESNYTISCTGDLDKTHYVAVTIPSTFDLTSTDANTSATETVTNSYAYKGFVAASIADEHTDCTPLGTDQQAKLSATLTNAGSYTGNMSVSFRLQSLTEQTLGYLTFSSDDDFKLSVTNKGWDGTIEYTTDKGTTWSEWDGSQLSGTATQPIYLRGTNNTKVTGGSYYKWTFTGKSCTGNIETLLDYQKVLNNDDITMTYSCYSGMFEDCTSIKQAPDLPATTLTDSCYREMFKGCTSLTQASDLPATTLTDYCYSQMFSGCTSLTQAPDLSATTLTERCYYEMFRGCTSLTQAPDLSATTLAEYCCYGMFFQCESLTQAPALPATTLVENCYGNMFGSCTKLSQAPALPATTLAESCYYSMFQNCSSLKFSETQTDEYQYEYRIPTTGTIETDYQSSYYASYMLSNTGGTFKSSPSINTTYYTTNPPVQ